MAYWRLEKFCFFNQNIFFEFFSLLCKKYFLGAIMMFKAPLCNYLLYHVLS